MTAPRKYAEIAAAALAKMLKASTELGKGADIVESVLAEATREQEEIDRQHLPEVEAAASVGGSDRSLAAKALIRPKGRSADRVPYARELL